MSSSTSVSTPLTGVPALPDTHKFVVNYTIMEHADTSAEPVARIFMSERCTWGDIVEEWFGAHAPSILAERYVLTFRDMVIGWDLPLGDQLHPDALIIDVMARSLEPGVVTHLAVGIAYRLMLAGQGWPAWRPTDTCPVNGLLLGGDYPDARRTPVVSEYPPCHLDNAPCNMVGVRFMGDKNTIWCNRYALLRSLNDTTPTRKAAEADVFLTRVAAAASARSLPPDQIDKSFPVVFDPVNQLRLPVIVFDRRLAWLDLSYSGALSSSCPTHDQP